MKSAGNYFFVAYIYAILMPISYICELSSHGENGPQCHICSLLSFSQKIVRSATVFSKLPSPISRRDLKEAIVASDALERKKMAIIFPCIATLVEKHPSVESFNFSLALCSLSPFVYPLPRREGKKKR